MKPRFTFQTLILITLAPAVALLTAFWTWQVYRSTYRIILDGFDRKLLTLAGGAAAFTDGDAHGIYQRPRSVSAIAPVPTGFVGFDENFGQLVAINNTGGAQPLLLPTTSINLRSLAQTPAQSGFFGLSDDGTRIFEIDTVAPRLRQTKELTGTLDGIAILGGELMGWHGTALFRVDMGSGALTTIVPRLPEPLRALACDRESKSWIGLSLDGTTLLVLDAQAQLMRRVALYSLADAPAPAEDSV